MRQDQLLSNISLCTRLVYSPIKLFRSQFFNNDGIYFKGLEERDSHVLALFLIAT